jgi:mono/diheme cytochrome c family protein
MVAGGGDDVGDDDGELPPPPDEFGIVTSPRTGDAIANQGGAATLLVQGMYTSPDVVIDIQAQTGATWTTIAHVQTSATPVPDAAADDDPRYPFLVVVDASAVWPPGGLLHLRAQADGLDLIGFFDDVDACRAAWPSWRIAAQHCGNLYGAQTGITMVSTDLDVESLVGAGTFLDDKGLVTPDETAAYYQQIDAPATVTDFRARYLVDGEVTAAYYTAGDLATGREMHCGTFPTAAGPGVGCYVHNYGLFGSTRSDAEAELAAGVAAGAGTGSFATVAMVYTPPITAPNAVQFIVYGPAQTLVTEAILDTHGDNAAIPSNCTNCHGSDSQYDATTHTLTGARLLPFDPAAFDFLDQPGLRRVDQEESLRALNQLVLASEPGFAASSLIRGLYGAHVETPGVTANTDWVAPGWSGESASHVYREVIAPYCRGCHASREGLGGAETWDLADEQRFRASAATIQAVVCSNGNLDVHRMPNAEATQRRFWESRARAYLGAIIDIGACTP